MSPLKIEKLASPVLFTLLCLTAVGPVLVTVAMANPQGSQARGQRQSGLTPEKKRSLSNYGPEDVFPADQADRPQQQRPAARPASRRSSRSTPSPTPQPTEAPVMAATPELSPTIPAEATGAVRQPLNNAQAPPEWLLPTLVAITLIVLTAFLYTVYKLYEKLRASGR
ncbi:MAG: hypothetical protein IPM66_04540 [Acidobacteriota bacterium]|nr:MAG: hypothetical protein IPM66_04540 [Acidobacteriota bacterium]